MPHLSKSLMSDKDKKAFCRYAPSLGALEGTPEEVWGTPPYKCWKHLWEPTIFFGLYDFRDYIALWFHRGHKWVLWAGSDVRNLASGFAFNDGKLRILSKALKGVFTRWIVRVVQGAENYVENDWEGNQLAKMGVSVAGVCPSFMGQLDLPSSFAPAFPCNVYLSASEGRQEEYGWGIVESIASWLPNHVFHLYGAAWKTEQPNVMVHGRVPKEQMNEEIKGYQIGLRLNETDGFSEILAKAVLMGQYAVGKVKHPYIPSFDNDMDLILRLNKLAKEEEPNPARQWYRYNANAYPWVSK